MKTNTKNTLVVLALAVALTSCGEHNLDDLLDDPSSSSGASGGKPSSSSKKIQSSSSGNISSSSNVVIIEDENIAPAASFAQEFFSYTSFPYYLSEYGWLSISESYGDKFDELDRYISYRDEDGSGEAFNFIFKLLYENKEEYLSNGKFKRYIELIPNFIPRRMYVSNGWDAIVRQLLFAYEDLAGQPGSFSDVYEVMEYNSCNYCIAAEAYYAIIEFVRDWEEFEDYFNLEQDDYYRSAVVWAYSFWGRRYNEDPSSIEPIVDILNMLRDKYK